MKPMMPWQSTTILKCCRLLIALIFEIATATARLRSKLLQGYPIPTSKKKRVCVVTYRHSGGQLFENSLPPHANVNDLWIYFGQWREIWRQHCISNLCTDSKPWRSERNTLPALASVKLFLPAPALNHFRCGK